MAKKKKTGWTPGKGGSKKAQDYYREKQAEYGRRPDQGSRRPKKDARIKQAEKTRNRILQEAQKNPNFVIEPELFTRNKAGISNADPTGKLREGMTGAEYHDFMRQLHGANPAAMEKAFPWGSGKGLRSLANLAMPAPLKMFGEMAGDMGTTVKQGLTKIFPGPAKDFGAEYKRLQSSFPWNRKKNEKISETLEMITDPSQNIYDTHPGSAIHPESENIFNEDLYVDESPAVGDLDILKDLEGEITLNNLANHIEESISQNEDLGYDPVLRESMATLSPVSWEDKVFGELEQDLYNQDPVVDTRKAGPYETDDWMGEIQPKIGGALDVANKDARLNELFAIEEAKGNVMPNVPATREQKELDYQQKKARVIESGLVTQEFFDKYPDFYGTYKDMNRLYNEVIKNQGEGKEFGPFEGVINKPRAGYAGLGRNEYWQHPGTAELVDQIEWNTANRPVDWSGGETPVLDEDFIKENFTTDWGFNQGGIASIDPYRGTMGGGMNPSGWSPDPTARSVTGYEKGGLMNNGNPVDYHNLRNTNKYYGSF